MTLDALRADHLSSYGYERETSPRTDALADDGVRFEHAHSQSSHTREAIPAILSGRDPDATVDESYLLATDTIATMLADTDVRTGGFHSNPYVSRAYGFDRDFDAFDDDLHLGSHKLVALAQRALDKLRNRHYARAEEINERALSWVDSLDDERFFLWNHYMDPHGPYEPPEPYRSHFGDHDVSDRRAQRLYQRAVDDPDSITDEERRLLVDYYDGEIAYADEWIGRFVDELRERGLWEETLFILTADHGDAFGEHGYYEHPRYLHGELTRVPMLVFGGGVESSVVDVPVSTRDVVPTVLDALGVDGPSLPGESLCEVARDTSAFDDRIAFSQARGETEPVRRFAARDRDGVCYLERGIDDGEIVSEDSSGGSRGLASALRSYSQSRLGFGDGTTEVGDTDAVSDRLDALGYK